MYLQITITPELLERFGGRYERRGVNECWPWLLAPNSSGYGEFSHKGVRYLAHRVATTIRHGPIEEFDALHSCDIRICVNPAHLSPGTKDDNRQDCVQKRRQARRDGHGQAKLTWAKVKEIRRRAAAGEFHRVLAHEFGVAKSNIGSIVNELTWKP